MAGFFTMLWAWLRSRGKATAQAPASPVNPVAGSGTYEPQQDASGQPQGYWDDPFGYYGSELQITGASSFFQPTQPPAQPTVDPVEKDWLARTIWGEARGDGAAGMRAVAAVIMNRVASRRYPNTVQGVVLQPWQFSMWIAGEPNGAAARAVTDADRNFRTALGIAEDALTGRLSDPTDGATLYYAPAAMVPAGSTPRWDFSKLRYVGQIGGHRFYVET